ncbi:FH2 domain-containing protein 1-like [Anarrhichthys ocellatus]|uniref:FH2 domain-containing protein 1-like n=1 Tax=Anarrhichthys ocellatus TaxID=433405 RepID=UPI0012ED7CEE|nr:FH2 domain-containing protein 1-like [Anarrhichthys ocellatus]
MCCEELHAVLHLVLQAGNLLNAGGYAGNAVGFKLSSLLSLADTKANKPGMNLLHFVALEAQKKDTKLLEFPLKLNHVQPASRISLETLDAELQWQTSRTRSVEENVQRDTELLQQLDGFLQSATSSLSSLHDARQHLKKEGSELIDFFCEDKETFRLDDCFSIFNSFCSRFTGAVKENIEREAKEAARRRRLQDLEEQKRHSWAGSEEVDGAVGLRCRSEADMTAAVSAHDDARLLVELLSPKFGSRSLFNNSHNSLRRSGSSRRSRNSLLVVAADRELSTLLGLASPDHKEARTAFLSASPERRPQSPRVTTCSFPQNQQPEAGHMAPRLNHTTATYLSNDANNGIDPANAVKTTSDPNQQSDHNNGKDRLCVGALSDPKYGSKSELVRVNKADHIFSGNMSMVVEKCTLVPELKVFGEVAGRHEGPHTARHCRRDEEDRPAKKVQDDSQIGNAETKEEEEGGEEKVVVWCVTGVCEAAGELEHTDDTRTERDQRRSDNRGGSQQASSAPANRTPSEPQPANEKPVPEPISSQPVPVPRRDDPSHPASSPMWHPAEPAAANGASVVGAREAKGTANQRGEAEGSTNEKRDVEIVPTGDGRRNKTASCRTEAASSTKGKAESANLSKLSTKNLPTSKTRPAGTKPVTAAFAANKSRPLRTLTSTENQSMRRVLPISRTSRGAPTPGQHPEKPPGHQRGSSSAAATAGPTAHNLNGTSSTAPSSRRSSVHKTPDPKNSKDQKVSGTQEQNQDVQRRPSIRKPLAKPKPPPEEKMCRSTLRSLSQASGGGGSFSAPVTPSHKAGTPSSSPLPGFARSTASSSFRRTLTPLTPPPPPPPHHSPHSGSISSFKSSLKTSSSSAAPSGTISPFTRTGSLRVSSTSTSSDLLKPSSSSSALRSQSIRAPPRSPLHDPLVPPKGHRRNDSGTFSDKSSHSRDSGKSTRRSWR